MRIHSSELFIAGPNGITLRVPIQINGVTMGGAGISISPGVAINGVDLGQLLNRWLEVDEVNGVYVIRGVY